MRMRQLLPIAAEIHQGKIMSDRRIVVSRHVRLLAGLGLGFVVASDAFSQQAIAGTATTTLPISITITAGCTVSATSVAFPTTSTLGAAVTATGTLSATCTNTTPYTVSLDKGSGSGATTTVRKMTGPSSAVISYGLFQNAAFSTNFGSTVGTDTVAGTGSGIAQPITVYGQVPVQASPAPGSYADVVNVIVAF